MKKRFLDFPYECEFEVTDDGFVKMREYQMPIIPIKEMELKGSRFFDEKLSIVSLKLSITQTTLEKISYIDGVYQPYKYVEETNAYLKKGQLNLEDFNFWLTAFFNDNSYNTIKIGSYGNGVSSPVELMAFKDIFRSIESLVDRLRFNNLVLDEAPSFEIYYNVWQPFTKQFEHLGRINMFNHCNLPKESLFDRVITDNDLIVHYC